MSQPITSDLYAVLDVPPVASDDQIKAAYRQLVRRHHPDANPARREEAEVKIKTIIAAYGVLGDPQKRARYDSANRLHSLNRAQTASRGNGRGDALSLLGRVSRALGIDSHELAGKLGLADAVLLEMEGRDAIPATPVQLRTFTNLCRRAAMQLEQKGRFHDADELRLALDRKLAQRAMFR